MGVIIDGNALECPVTLRSYLMIFFPFLVLVFMTCVAFNLWKF
jgi:hypothetical protein